MQHFDAIEREYIIDKGWHINADGLLVLTAKQAEKEQYIGRSIHNHEQRTLMIPSVHGCCLLFEGQHFIIQTDHDRPNVGRKRD